MFPLLETIRLEDGKLNNTEYHFRRMQRSVKECFGQSLLFNPEEALLKIPTSFNEKKGLFKVRLLYGNTGYRLEIIPYKLPDIKTLKPVIDNSIEYGCKYSDRTVLNRLRQLKGAADDVLIIKNGEVTDASFANIVFYDGKKWVTPKNPLLRGTQRAWLLDSGMITETIITPVDLPGFTEARIINAMIRFEDEAVA